MKYLKFAVENMEVKRQPGDKTALITGAVNYFGLEFKIDDDFNSIDGTKSVEMFKNRTKKRIDLVDGKCVIPSEFLRDKTAMELRVLSGDTVATPWISVNITESGMIEQDEPEEDITEGTSYVKSPSGDWQVAQLRIGYNGLEYSNNGSDYKNADGSAIGTAAPYMEKIQTPDSAEAKTVAQKLNEIIDVLAACKIVDAKCPKGENAVVLPADDKDFGRYGGKVTNFYDEKPKIDWNGTKGTVTGTFKWITKDSNSKLASDGNYYPLVLSDFFKEKQVKVNGKQVSDFEIICNITDKSEIKVEYEDEVVAILDLTGAERKPKEE